MPETLLCSLNGTVHANVSPADVRTLLAQPENVVWLDIRDMDERDEAMLHDLFQFHPLALEDIRHGNGRPKIEVYENYYFIIFYAASEGSKGDRFVFQPLYLFAGLNYLVTVHDGELRQIAETIRRWRDPNGPPGHRIGLLLHAVLDTIVDDYFPLVDSVAEEVEAIEGQIFDQFERSSIQSIFGLKRDLLAMRRVVAPERDVLNVLIRRELPVFRGKDIAYLQDVYDHTIRVTDSVDNYRELLSSALDSYLSVEASRQNQILKVLTVASIILMTNALIAGIYGMNFEFMPELHWIFGYPYALGMMILASVALIIMFRRLKWI